MLPLLGLAIFWSAGVNAQTLIASDPFDNDISDWTTAGDAGAEIAWDGTLGSPERGSLKLTAPSGVASVDGFRAAGQCRDVLPVQAYTAVAQVREALDSRVKNCLAAPVFYDSTDCQGEGSIGGIGDGASPGGWQSELRSLTSFSTSRSMRVELIMAVEDGEGEATCHFDSMRLYEGRFAEAIPFLSRSGLLVLVLAVACVAWIRGFRPA